VEAGSVISETIEAFTREQEQVIDLPPAARAIVDAPAGTGKTHVLAGRAARLIGRDGLTAGDEVLILSFSRAAVSELRVRVSRLGGDARYVGASTFDAFATQILATEEPDDSWLSAGYDQRIRKAVNVLQRPETPQLLTMVKHVLVDEIQDLVGSRALLVMALLSQTDAGFTLFGDPAQAIYGHQLRADDGPTNPQLYSWFLETFGEQSSRWTLTQDFRGKTDFAQAITHIGVQLRAPDPDHARIATDTQTLLLKLPATTLGAAKRLLTRGAHTTSAMLCRSNAEALRISSDLFDRGVRHRYQRRGEDKAAAGWLSRALSGMATNGTTRASLEGLLEPIARERHSTVDELFALVRRLDPARGDGVDLRRVANRLRESSFPEELNEVVASTTVVSTIHRAKGLEFDRVFLCDSEASDDSNVGEENRLLYVALTRARAEIFHIDAPETKGLRLDPRSGRWIRRGWGPEKWRLYELEVAGADSDSTHPAGTWYFEDDACALQEYLGRVVRPGDSVDLNLVSEVRGDTEPPHYLVAHHDRTVAVTSDAFGRLIRLVLGPTRRAPQWILGLHVEMVDTVAGDAALGRRHGLGGNGIWARVRVFGLGTLAFNRTDAEGG
jgi:hypothetical protein